MLEMLQQLMRAERYREVLCLVESEFSRPGVELAVRQRLALLGSKVSGELSQWGKASDWARLGLEIHSSDREVQGMLHLRAGTAAIFMPLANLTDADEHLRTFLNIATKEPALNPFRKYGYYNLAYVHRARQEHEQEFHFLKQALETAERVKDRHFRAVCHQEIAWCQCLLGRPSVALAWVDAARSTLWDCFQADSELRVDLLLSTGFAHALSDNRLDLEAVHVAINQHRHNQPSGCLPDSQESELAFILALDAFRSGELSQAAGNIGKAARLAQDMWFPSQVDRISRLKNEIEAAVHGHVPER